MTLDNNHIVPDTKPEEQKAANKASQDAQYSRRGEEAREVRSNSREPRHRYSVRSSHIFGHYPKRPFKHASIEWEREREREHKSCLIIRVADPVFLHGSGSGFQISLDPDPDPDPVSKFSGSGFSQDSGKLQKGL